MKTLRCVLAAGVALACGAAVMAQKLQSESIVRQQQVQQRVRTMARELVGGVLDQQMQQLRENGLQSHQVYGEIADMRKNLDALIEKEMPEVIRMLGQIEAAKGSEREKTFVGAREKSREVVVSLYVQRQALLRRLKIAEMAAQVRQLILHQTNVLTSTEGLPEQPQARREALNLSTLEDQRDVHTLYGRFSEVLTEVSRWTGPFGLEAAEGLRLAKDARIDDELGGAEKHLQAAAYPEASTSQKAVIRGLQSLLAKIEKAQGLADADRNAMADKLRDLINQQEKLREETKKGALDQDKADQLAGQQNQVRKDVAKLADAAERQDMKRALDKAQQAAAEASTDLFEQKQSDAVEQQNNVVNNLEKAADLADLLEGLEAGLNSEQYEKRIDDLEAARADLAKVEREQAKANDQAATNPAEAKKAEKQASQDLAKIPQGRDLPKAVEGRIEEARDETAEAANAKPENTPKEVAEADRAVERAVSETEAALADAKRERLGAEIAELAHAARALDEAAKAERNIAKESGEAAKQQGLQADKAKEMAQDQADVKAIADKVAQGVQQTAPDAAKTLQEAAPAIREAGKQLEAAERQPGEASKPAAEKAAGEAANAAEKIEKAAEQVRQEMRKALEEMRKLGGEQIEQVQDARQDVEKGLAEAMAPLGEKPAEKMAELAKKAGELAKENVPVDPGANAALREAQEKAGEGAQEAKTPEAAGEAKEGVEQAMGEAGASLASRENQIAQDMAAAEAMAAAGEKQPEGQQVAGEPAGQPAGEQPGGQPSGEQPGGQEPGGQPAGEQPGGEPGGQQPGQPGAQPGNQPGGQPAPMPPMQGLANQPIREASQLAAELAGIPAGAQPGPPGMPGMQPGMMPGMQPGMGIKPIPGPTSPMATAGGVSQSGQPMENQAMPPRPLQKAPEEVAAGTATPDSDKDAENGDRKFLEKPWMAKLPPEARGAIRGGAQHRPPRGYESRLQRYFENID